MIDEYVPYRIQRIYSSSTEKERYYLKKILEEISETGDSQTYRDIWLSDYVEIPVDIDTFLRDNLYLGKTNRNGEAVYPFWQDFMRKLFHAGNKYEEVFFTGATRIGKSSTAITCTSYMLYKLMCLRDPQQYFGKKDISVFSILFFNLTKDLASGVGYREFQDTVLSSPWFLDHGSRMGSDKNPYYVPDGGKVSIDFGSDAAHGLGKQVFCVTGDTKILTKEGYVPIYLLEDQEVELAQFSGQEILYCKAKIMKTKYVRRTTRVRFKNGSEIEATPEHQIMVDTDHSYIEIQNLRKGDRVISAIYDEFEVDDVKSVFYFHKIPVYDVIDAKPYHNFIADDIVVHNCVVGSTKVLTDKGFKRIEDIASQNDGVNVYSYDSASKQVEIRPADGAKLMKYVSDTIRIELEDGTVLEGTPDHKIMLSDGSYKMLKDLTISDDLLTLNINDETSNVDER